MSDLPAPVAGFRPVAVGGWGDGYNSYAHSMEWFDGRLYVGSARANLYLIRRRNPPPRWPIYPVPCPKDPFTLDLRAQIWRYDPTRDAWEHVHTAPVVRGRDGAPVPREIGYRGMVVFQGPSDDAPALYVTTFAPTRAPGPLVLRSTDGRVFEPVCEPGFGLAGISAFRTLVPFKGRLYTSPVGSTRNRPNLSTYPIVFESADPRRGEWRPVSVPGFGNPDNAAIFEMAVFDGHLYAGTFNCVTGLEIWRTDAEGPAPYRWTQVLRAGAYRGVLNEGALSLCAFGDALYVGTAIQDGGFDRANRVGPAAGEVLRLFPDDSWELVVGTSRLTPHGLRLARSGLGPGFGNFFNGYIWRMAVHDGWLYAGTWDWSVFLRYVDLAAWPPPLRELVEGLGVDDTVRLHGGFDLWRTRNGTDWEPVTRTGFDNPYNCGARTLVSTPYGLAVGTANPFGPQVAVRQAHGWTYAANPRGGLEVWLGAPGPYPVTASPAASVVLRDAARPTARRRPDRARFEWSREELEARRQRINVPAVRPDVVALARAHHALRLEHPEHLPKDRPVVVASNHTGLPLLAGSTFITEDLLLTINLLTEHLGRPPRTLVDVAYYDDPVVQRMSRRVVDRLGYVPVTVGNGVRLLELGETVLIYPEGRSSAPAYGTRRFAWGFAKMAWLAGVPVVPAALVGPLESRPRIERDGRQVVVGMHRPLPAEYRLILSPPLDVRQHVPCLEDTRALSAFAELVRRRIQETLDAATRDRPWIAVARALQARWGDADPSAVEART